MNIIEIILVCIASVLFVGMVIITIKALVENARLINKNIQLYKDNVMFLNKIEELSAVQDLARIQQNDDFVKFLSDSRSDAFNYIEDVQDKIRSLVVAWNYHTTQMPPDGTSEHKLYEAYSDVVSMLPEDTNND
jgi:hypothetical protein